MVAGLALLGLLVAGASPPPKGESPVVPIRVQVNAPFPLTPELQDKLGVVSQDLIRANLPDILAKSSSVNAEVNVLEKTPQGYRVEVLVVSLLKETYTALMSRIEFVYENDRATIRKIEPAFKPEP